MLKCIMLLITAIIMVAPVKAQILEEGLFAHYTFNVTLNDSSEFENHLITLDGVAEFPDDPDDERFVRLDGSTRLRSSLPFVNTGWTQTAVSLWLRSSQRNSNPISVIQGAFLGFGMGIAAQSGNISPFFDFSFSGSISSNGDVLDGEWHHVLAQTDGETTFLYIDGVFDGQIQEDLVLGDGGDNNRIYFGQTNLGLGDYTGDLDEVRIYNRILTYEEIEVLSTGRSSNPEDNSTLPVSLSWFMGALNKSQVDLQWTTASEINNKGFEVQRSQAGVNWQSIEFVPGAGDSNEASSYLYTDPTPFSGINYYRLKQMNDDGTFSFSETITVNNVEASKVSIYPNPTTNYINWLPEVPKSFTLFNSNGQKVRVGEGTRIDVIGLPLGMYYLKLEGEKLRKVVIQHRGVYP